MFVVYCVIGVPNYERLLFSIVACKSNHKGAC
jgi:hypothetical protein